MSTYEETKSAAISAIAKHLAEHGSGNWKPVRSKHPKISESTWWRLVKAVSEGKPHDEIMARSVKKAKWATPRTQPSAPAPDIAFIEIFGELIHRAAVVLDWSAKVDAEGVDGAKNPVFFAASIKLKRDLAETCVRAIHATIGAVDFAPTMLRKIADAVLDAINIGVITDEDREHLRYALGLSDAVRRPIRNHYLARPDDPAMSSMIERGLMRTEDVCYRGWQFFHATHAGAAAIGQVLPERLGNEINARG